VGRMKWKRHLKAFGISILTIIIVSVIELIFDIDLKFLAGWLGGSYYWIYYYYPEIKETL
jgi:hypothetical protein